LEIFTGVIVALSRAIMMSWNRRGYGEGIDDDRAVFCMRRLAMSVLVTAGAPVGESGGVEGGVSTMLKSLGHDKSRSRQMRLLRSRLGPDDEEDLADTTCRLGTVLRILSLAVA
jgi:hypothetical protein